MSATPWSLRTEGITIRDLIGRGLDQEDLEDAVSSLIGEPDLQRVRAVIKVVRHGVGDVSRNDEPVPLPDVEEIRKVIPKVEGETAKKMWSDLLNPSVVLDAAKAARQITESGPAVADAED